jgi:hypothetical protein
LQLPKQLVDVNVTPDKRTVGLVKLGRLAASHCCRCFQLLIQQEQHLLDRLRGCLEATFAPFVGSYEINSSLSTPLQLVHGLS